jgi:hypothetical protein
MGFLLIGLAVLSLIGLDAGISSPPQTQSFSHQPPTPSCLEILIPLYIYPNWYDPANYVWDDVATANSQTPIVAIINPNNGPTSPPNSDYIQGLNDLQAGDVKIIGYVRTDYTNTPLATVKADIDIYANEYSSWLSGIFFDEASNNAGDIPYYDEIYDYARAITGFDTVVINPGTGTDEGYFSTPATNIGVIFETYGSNWAGHIPASYVQNYDRNRFAMLAHEVTSSATMQSHIDLAVSRNFGYVYITDDMLLPNPWDSLPSYWTTEVSHVASYNVPAIAPAITSIGYVSPTIALTWSTESANVGGYTVYRSENPYFSLDSMETTLITTTQQANYGDMVTNFSISNFYGISGIDKCGRGSGVAGYAGIFPFSIIPGNP